MTRRRPCQHCTTEVEVEAGVAVDERHRRGRCADLAEAVHQHTAAELAAERDGIPGGRIGRMAF